MPAQNSVPENQKDAVYKAQQAEITRKKLAADRKAQQQKQTNNNRGGR